MIMCVLLCYPVSIHMSQLLSTGRPISSLFYDIVRKPPWKYEIFLSMSVAPVILLLNKKYQ